MLDGADHRVGLSRPDDGPDFSMVLDFDWRRDPDAWARFADMVVRPLGARLRQQQRFDVVVLSENKWHPLHVRCSLLEVLRGTSTADQQRVRLAEGAKEYLQMLLSGGELRRWAEDCRRREKNSSDT